MAYKQTPGRGNQSKTGNGIPAPFKQVMGATGLGAGTAEGKYATKKAKEVGSKIKEGAKKLDKALEGKYMSTKEREASDTAFGVRLSGSKAGTKAEKNSKSGSPAKQTKPNKEKSTWETVKETASKVGGKIVEGARKLDKALEGKYMPTREREASDTAFGVRLSGAKAGTKVEKNPKSGSDKKTPAKMKKC